MEKWSQVSCSHCKFLADMTLYVDHFFLLYCLVNQKKLPGFYATLYSSVAFTASRNCPKSGCQRVHDFLFDCLMFLLEILNSFTLSVVQFLLSLSNYRLEDFLSVDQSFFTISVFELHPLESLVFLVKYLLFSKSGHVINCRETEH